MTYTISVDDDTGKYRASLSGNSHSLTGEGKSLYAAIDDLEAKIIMERERT
ncbi:MAG: hypothetical protein ACRDF4_09435 [Rhabdochlamydiaceae bacterium]